MEQLLKLPLSQWAEQNKEDDSLLHYACCGPNVAAAVALLKSRRVGVNLLNTWDNTPARQAIFFSQSRMLEVLCAAGANLRARNHNGDAPIDDALIFADKDNGKTMRVLVANGVRLSTANEDSREYITPELVAFERGVLHCRSVVAAMLRVKRVGQLWRWDKFLLRELAYAVWATRYDKGWQN